MRKKAFVTLTALTLLFTPVSSRACEMTPGCLGITAKITRGIVRIIRDIYNIHHNNRHSDGDTNLAPRNIVEEMMNNINNNSRNHNMHTQTGVRKNNNG